MIESIFAILAGYLLGSFPSAFIAARLFKKRDIRELGGGNMGTLNTMREIGFVPGILVLLFDVFKGVATVLLARWLGVHFGVTFAAGLAAIIGHNYPAYLSFRGGRGGAVALGVLAALVPPGAAAVGFGIMLAAVFLTSNMRLALSAGFIALPLLTWAFGGEAAVALYALGVALLLGIRLLISDRHLILDRRARKNLIFDHDFTPWQTRRRKNSPGSEPQGTQIRKIEEEETCTTPNKT
jgi:glycerol-3-phosphate acyltransferase PlsY